jgi:hypothetical protein
MLICMHRMRMKQQRRAEQGGGDGPLRARSQWWLLLMALVVGCAGQRTATMRADLEAPTATGDAALFEPVLLPESNVLTAPPVGWRVEPVKRSARHTHHIWLSPSGQTAYGVIHFTMPAIAQVIPVPLDWVLRGYLDEMRKDQGEAVLLSKQRDPNLPGLRFVAEGGLYRTWTNLITSGRHGWAIYAGVLRDKPLSLHELELAREARDRTIVHLTED